MVNHSAPQPATQNRWHERIERYTPDDASSRLLIAIPSGAFGVYTLTWSVATFMTSGLLLPLTLLLVAISLGAIILAVVMVWPIYLSLIGNVESVKAYSEGNATSVSEENRDDSIAVAKRQYAAGNITEEEFERRVENLLHADVRSQSRTTQREGSETLKEIN